MSIQPTNIVSIKTGKTLLPFQVRAILMAQYAESKESNKSSDDFVKDLEMRLLTAGASTVLEFVRDLAQDFISGGVK